MLTHDLERFYGERIGVKDILAGKARHPPYEIRKLLETVKAAQGDTDVDESLLPSEPPPGDYEIEQSKDESFGIPDKEDPDPYGVLALQNAGLEIKEAGTNKRPTSEQFEFHPSPTSPIYTTFRKSFDRSSFDGRTNSRRSSWRTSTISSVLEPRTPTTMVDMSTQTDLDAPTPIQVPPKLPPRHNRTPSPVLADIPELKAAEDAKAEQTEEEVKPVQQSEEVKPAHESEEIEAVQEPEEPKLVQEPEELKIVLPSEEKKDTARETEYRPTSSARNSKAFDDVDLDEEEPIIEEIHQAAASQAITRARIVQVAKPIPPKLPPRNPFRNRISVNSNLSNDDSTRDASAGPSPMVGRSPPSTPSLNDDGSSASSLSSIEGLDRVSQGLQPHASNDPKATPKEEKDDFHSLPESPVKTIPGGFN